MLTQLHYTSFINLTLIGIDQYKKDLNRNRNRPVGAVNGGVWMDPETSVCRTNDLL